MNANFLRRKVIQHTVFAALPTLSVVAQSPAPSKRPSFQVDSGVGRPGTLPDAGPGDVKLKISGRDTGGEFALFEVPRGNSGPPLHVHHIENELFWVLEGELDVQVGSEIFRLSAGDCAYAPKMIPHTWQPVGGHDTRFLSFAEPAGHLEEFIDELLRRRRKGLLDPASMKSLFEKYEMEVVGPPLPKRAKQ